MVSAGAVWAAAFGEGRSAAVFGEGLLGVAAIGGFRGGAVRGGFGRVGIAGLGSAAQWSAEAFALRVSVAAGAGVAWDCRSQVSG